MLFRRAVFTFLLIALLLVTPIYLLFPAVLSARSCASDQISCATMTDSTAQSIGAYSKSQTTANRILARSESNTNSRTFIEISNESENILMNGDFEVGSLMGWSQSGLCRIDSTIVHSGSYSAFIEADTWGDPHEISQFTYPRLRLSVDTGLTLDTWVRPFSVGWLNGQESISGIVFEFRNINSSQLAFYLKYSWGLSKYAQNTSSSLQYLLPLTANAWNHLAINLTSNTRSYFGDMDYSDIVLASVAVKCYDAESYRFYIDDLKVSARNFPYVILNSGFEDGLQGWEEMSFGPATLGITTENVHDGNNSLHISSSLQDYAGSYQFIDCPSSSYRFSFWIYQGSGVGETVVELISKHPWVDGAGWSPAASIFNLRQGMIFVDAWRWTEGNDPPYQLLNRSLSQHAWHNVVFEADARRMIQKVYVDGDLSAVLNSSSGLSFAPEIVIIGDFDTDMNYGDYYFDDVSLAAISTPDMLSISVYPSSASVQVNNWLWFTATVNGGIPPYSYQWYLDGNPVWNAMESTWIFSSGICGVYYVFVNVTDSDGVSANSQPTDVTVANVTVSPNPLIVSIDPLYTWIQINDSVSFTSVVDGGLRPYTYQWYLDDSLIAGATSPTLMLTPEAEGIHYIFFVVTDAQVTSKESPRARLSVTAVDTVIKRPDELVEATIEGSDPQTVDPAYCYDTASAELLQNVYDTLVCFDGEQTGRYMPQLATEWAVENITGKADSHDSETGLDWFYRYTFKIRENVPFHDPSFGYLSTEDVEYCFERAMILDMAGGPTWMFYEPLLNGATAIYINQHEYDPENSLSDRILLGKMIDHSVESNSTHVWFNLAFPGAYSPFMQILALPWSSIYSRTWALSLGRPTVWNGAWGDYAGWWTCHNPSVPPFDDPTPAMMGTGPFILAHLDRDARYWDANRFSQYWRGWPVDWPADSVSRPAGYVNHLVVTWAYDWSSRSAMFLNGDVDFCSVPTQYINEVIGKPGIRCVQSLPGLSVSLYLFNFNINESTPFGPVFGPGVFNETGVPSDFFGNAQWGTYVRKAFAHSINFTRFIEVAYLGEATQPATAIVPGLPYYDPTITGYTYNLTETAELFRQVPGLWDTGFTIQLVIAASSSGRGLIVPEMIKQAVESLNPRFHVSVNMASWSTYLYAVRQGQLPTTLLAWLADYPDPHNFAYAFYYSRGNFAGREAYVNPEMDALVEKGIATTDGPERASIYHDIQQLAIDDCPSVALDQHVGRHFERSWVCGWYYNPINPGIYAANLWKWYYIPHEPSTLLETSNYLPADVNYDGRINIVDITVAALAFGSGYGPPVDRRWNFRADVNNDRIVNILDIATLAKSFGKTSAVWVPSV